jgi:O-antigen ligase
MAAFIQYTQKYRVQLWYLLFTALFMGVVWFATKSVNLFLFGLPLVVIFAYITITDYKYVWYGLVFLMPLSITDHEFFGSIGGLTFPTDLLCLLLLAVFVFKMVSERTNMLTFLAHPVPILIGLQLLWLLFTSTASYMPVVSWKATLAATWLIAGFYLIPVTMFRNGGTQPMIRFFELIAISFSIAFVIIMMLYMSTGRSLFGLRFNPGPFFLDHTVFGGFTATWVPIMVVLGFFTPLSSHSKFIFRSALFFFLAALFFSYSRGAWASCLAGLGLMGLYVMNKWVRRLVIPSLVVGFAVVVVMWYLGQGNVRAKNNAVSRKSFTEHVASITNFRTDYSNAERINRWYCAWEMWKDKPFFGYGPGTYMFVYGDYQKASVRTPVSTNRGDNGTAHNEFLLAMSETGTLGGFLMLAYFVVPIVVGLRGFRRQVDPTLKMLYLAVSFGIVTYGIHAWVNNFLDQDKVGGTYLTALAILTALDLYGGKPFSAKVKTKVDPPSSTES